MSLRIALVSLTLKEHLLYDYYDVSRIYFPQEQIASD
jgi:hypothetical protein